MEKIQVNDKVYIFLDHRKLINEAYSLNGAQKCTLRAELFEFHPRKSKADGDAEEVSRKKRKKFQTQKTPSTSAHNTQLLQFTAALKTSINLPASVEQLQPIPRFWEQYSACDFPKFKGANPATSFQNIDKLISDANFLIPPSCRFYNYDISELTKYTAELAAPFDIIVLDPPWRNKYIRRLKRHRLGYSMLECKQLEDIPIGKLICERSIVAVWCTNSKQHQEVLLQQLMPAWQLRPLHTIKWLKLNTKGEPIAALNTGDEDNGKQPFEMLYIACHQDAAEDYGSALKEVEMLTSIPSIIHSHKPPLLAWLGAYLSFGENPNCLELFARYLQPNFTSFGLEVLKLMDKRLYNYCEEANLDRS